MNDLLNLFIHFRTHLCILVNRGTHEEMKRKVQHGIHVQQYIYSNNQRSLIVCVCVCLCMYTRNMWNSEWKTCQRIHAPVLESTDSLHYSWWFIIYFHSNGFNNLVCNSHIFNIVSLGFHVVLDIHSFKLQIHF